MNSGFAAVLSLFVPGLGQLCQGRITGILWFIIVVLGYICFIVPGFILHILCIISAAMTKE